MKLSDVIKVWDELHVKDVGELGYCDLEKAVECVVGIDNDIDTEQPERDGDVERDKKMDR